MTQKELEDVLNGYVELEVDGNLYECIGHEETGDSSVRNVLLSDVNDGYAINRTIQELLEMPSDNIYIRTGAGRLEQIYQSDARNREVLEDSEYAVALLKVRPDIAEYDDIAHMEYDWACWRLGADRKPNAEMYTVAFAEPIAPDSIVKQSGTDDKSKAFALIANEFLQKMNDKNERPQEIDGYFGLLPDTSDVVLVKIEDTVKAYYNEGKLTEINYHQFADDSDKSVKKAPIEPER